MFTTYLGVPIAFKPQMPFSLNLPKIHSYYFAIIFAYLREGNFFTLDIFPQIHLYSVKLSESYKAPEVSGTTYFPMGFLSTGGKISLSFKETRGKYHIVFIIDPQDPSLK